MEFDVKKILLVVTRNYSVKSIRLHYTCQIIQLSPFDLLQSQREDYMIFKFSGDIWS